MSMAIDDPMWRRRRERIDERTQSKEITGFNTSAGTAKLIQLVDLAEPMIEQVNALYNQYINGVEKNPPTERRKQLDQTMQTVMLMGKPTVEIQFRCSNLRS